MAGVAQGDRIRSTDIAGLMRRINALESVVINDYSGVGSRLVAPVIVLTLGAKNGSNGFFTTDIDGGDKGLRYSSGGTLIDSGAIVRNTHIANSGTQIFLTKLLIGGAAELWRYSLDFSGETLIGDLDVHGRMKYADGKIFKTLSTSVVVLDPSDASELDSFSVSGANFAVRDDDGFYAAPSSKTISMYDHAGVLDTTFDIFSGWVVRDLDFNNGRLYALARQTVGSNFSWSIRVLRPDGTPFFSRLFEGNKPNGSRYNDITVDDNHNVFVNRTVDSPGIYALTPQFLDQTTFYKYPTASLGDKVSAGTPDGGVSIPALTFFEPDVTYPGGIIQRRNELANTQDAVEALAPFYVNAVTGTVFDWSVSSANNLHHVAVEAGDYDWDEIGVRGAITREDYIDAIDLCLTKLEASDLA